MSNSDRKSDDIDAIVLEKAPWATVEHLEKYMRAGLTQEDAQFLHDIPEKEQRKIFHKVDVRLCPMLMILYLISHLDRLAPGIHPLSISCNS
jgi:hypothetical protein